MATGACGINCDVCRLNLLGVCTTCGSGKSREAAVKLETQERVLGNTCPVLSCCCMNQKAYCIRDCSQFPCENHTSPNYPFGSAFLEMQKRRRQDWMPRFDPLGRPIEIPVPLWEALDKKDLHQLTTITQMDDDESGGLKFSFLDLNIRVDTPARQICLLNKSTDSKVLDIPLLTLTILTYLTGIDRLYPMGKDLISTKDMDRGNYFSDRYKLRKEPLLNRFSQDRKGLEKIAEALGAIPLDMAESAWAFHPFPRVALYYLFWDLEAEVPARLSILFDRSITRIFSPPMVWELVNLVNARILCA